MRKFLFMFVLCALCGISGTVDAGVRFITDVPRNSFSGAPLSGSSSSIKNRCASAGYRKNAEDCAKGTVPTNPCPYGGGYYKSCCDEEYKYTREYCLRRGLKPSNGSCEGKYACH